MAVKYDSYLSNYCLNLRVYWEPGKHTAPASPWSTGNGNPGNSGMTMQHFHEVSSRFARTIRLTRASPIPFSIFTSLTTVLQVGSKRCSQLYDAHTYEEIKNWFSMYTKCSDLSIAASGQVRYLRMHQEGLPAMYASWIECSVRFGVPSDHGPAERQICISQVPVRPMTSNSPGLNSGGGNKKGISLVWFYANEGFVIK